MWDLVSTQIVGFLTHRLIFYGTYLGVKKTCSRTLLSLIWVMWASSSPETGSTLNVSIAQVTDLDSAKQIKSAVYIGIPQIFKETTCQWTGNLMRCFF